jgi:C-terminal processing protease CtpA/Prc
VTTDEGVSVLHVVPSEPGQTIFPGELIVGGRDARVMRKDIESRGGVPGSLTIRNLNGEDRTVSWFQPPNRRSDAVTSRVLPDESLYVKIDSFTGFGPLDRGNFGSIQRHLILAKDGQCLILDLRGNPGGGRSALDTATLFFSDQRTFALFLGRREASQEGPELLTRCRRVQPEMSLLPWVSVHRILTYLEVMHGKDSFAIELTGDGVLAKATVVVLIDEATRSAAEMLASFLHEQCGATLIGRRSAGECAMPVMVALPHGWRAHLATLRVASGRGAPIEGRGLEPDIHVIHERSALAMGRDADIEQAVSHLAKRRVPIHQDARQR